MSDQTPRPPDPGAICFGLSPELDRRSCAAFLQLLGRAALAKTLSSRLSEQEIEELIGLTSGLMRKHLSKQEYHTLFLGEEHTHHDSDNQ